MYNGLITTGSTMVYFLLLQARCDPGNHGIYHFHTVGHSLLVPEFKGVDISL